MKLSIIASKPLSPLSELELTGVAGWSADHWPRRRPSFLLCQCFVLRLCAFMKVFGEVAEYILCNWSDEFGGHGASLLENEKTAFTNNVRCLRWRLVDATCLVVRLLCGV